jgi:hypothetical protein
MHSTHVHTFVARTLTHAGGTHRVGHRAGCGWGWRTPAGPSPRSPRPAPPPLPPTASRPRQGPVLVSTHTRTCAHTNTYAHAQTGSRGSVNARTTARRALREHCRGRRSGHCCGRHPATRLSRPKPTIPTPTLAVTVAPTKPCARGPRLHGRGGHMIAHGNSQRPQLRRRQPAVKNLRAEVEGEGREGTSTTV